MRKSRCFINKRCILLDLGPGDTAPLLGDTTPLFCMTPLLLFFTPLSRDKVDGDSIVLLLLRRPTLSASS